MSFDPKPGRYYRMPIFFGPTPGPREWPEGLECDFAGKPKRTVIGVKFLSDAAQLEALIPSCFKLWGEPVVTVEAHYVTEIEWLAGRGYDMCDVKFDVVFQGDGEPVHGTLVLVRFENLTDPILSGREEIGHNKLFCAIPPMRVLDGRHRTELSWLDHPFIKIEAGDFVEDDGPRAPADQPNQGMLSYKYIPKTGVWGEADVEYATLTPPAPNVTTTKRLKGTGKVEFVRSTWADLPTLHTLVNAFADLEVKEWRGAHLLVQEGGHSGANTRRLY